jgi:hypothetical protein
VRRLIFKSLVALVLLAAVAAVIAHRLSTQDPAAWKGYALPKMEFQGQPMTTVAATINAAVQKASGGAISHAVILDATPAPIEKVAADDELSHEMDRLIGDFRRHEQELVQKGASGYETMPYSGTVGGNIPLRCLAEELELDNGLEVKIEADAIRLSRRPGRYECRAYGISDGLRRLMEQERSANRLHVNAEPIVSAFATASGIHEWSVMLPEGPNRWVGEFRFDKVFRHIPNRRLILAIATPEEHREAESRLRSKITGQDRR